MMKTVRKLARRNKSFLEILTQKARRVNSIRRKLANLSLLNPIRNPPVSHNEHALIAKQIVLQSEKNNSFLLTNIRK